MGVFTILFMVVASIGLYGFATSFAIQRDPSRRCLRVMGALGGLMGSGLWLTLLAMANYLLLSTGLIRILTIEKFTPKVGDLWGMVMLGPRPLMVTPFFSGVVVLGSFIFAYLMIAAFRRGWKAGIHRPPMWGQQVFTSLVVVCLGATIVALDVYLLSFRLTTMVYPDLIDGSVGELPSLSQMLDKRMGEFGGSTIVLFGAAYFSMIVLSDLAFASAKARWCEALSEIRADQRPPAQGAGPAPARAVVHVAAAPAPVAPAPAAPAPAVAAMNGHAAPEGFVRRIPRNPGGQD